MNIRRREFVFMGVTLGILCAAWFLVLEPRGQAKGRMESQTQEKQRILHEIETSQPQALRHLKEDVARLEAIVTDHKARLPKEEKVEIVFQELSDLAKAHDLRIHQIRTNDIKPGLSGMEHPNINEQGFLLELEGKFQGVQAFLEQLEKQPRIIRIDELRLQRMPETSEARVVQASLRLRVFCQKGAETS